MTQTILKFPLVVADEQTVDLALGATILSVQFAGGGPLTLWALIDPDAAVETRTIRIYGTGQPFDAAPGTYLATVRRGPLDWRVFDGGVMP